MLVDVDEADVSILEESLSKSRALISNISSGLRKISQTSQRSETIIKPMIDASRNLEVYQKNVKSCLGLVENVKDIAAKLAGYERKLEDRNILENQLPLYLKCLKDAKQTSDDMRLLKIVEFRGIFDSAIKIIKSGETRLLLYAKDVIIQFSEPFDPRAYLNQQMEFPKFDENVTNNLMLIIQYFADQRHNTSDEKNDFLEIENIYIEQRRLFVRGSLGFMEKSTIPVLTNGDYHKNSNGIKFYTDALNEFMLSENELIIKVFSNIQYTNGNKIKNAVLSAAKKIRIFEKLMSTVLSTYVGLVSNIIDFINKNYASEGTLSFELIYCINKLEPTLDKLSATSGNNPSVKQLENMFANVKMVSANTFRENLKYIDMRIGSMKVMPPDNGICEFTSELLNVLKTFAEFQDVCLLIIGEMKPGTWIPTPKPHWLTIFSSVSTTQPINENDKDALLSSYFSDCLDAIIVTYEMKAKVLLMKRTSTVGYFLIANIHEAENVIKQSSLSPIFGNLGMERVEKLKKRAVNMFLADWKALASSLMDVTVIAGNAKKSKISSKDKETIKERFRTFNTEFDELVKEFKTYNVKDPQLKQSLIKDIGFIIPLYNRFHDKYVNTDFSKHSEKYIKYDSNTLASVIQGL